MKDKRILKMCLGSERTLIEAIELMRQEQIGAVLIKENSDYVGIFTERDFLTRTNLRELGELSSLKIKDFMTTELKTVDYHAAYIDVIELMRTNKIRHAPVSKEGQIVGMVSLRDLVSHHSEYLEDLVQKRTEELTATNEKLLREVKDRKRIEDTLQVTYREFLNQLEEAQNKLIQAEKMKVVGGLASGVAHEVKNPLMIIQQGVALLLKRIRTEDEDIRLTLTHIDSAVQRADRIVRGLLDFARSSELDIKNENINSVFDEALVFTNHHTKKNRIEVKREFQEDVPKIPLDKHKIEQVFINLILNAVASMPQGGTLTVRTYAKKITAHTKGVISDDKNAPKIGEMVLITEVEDTGTGISEEISGKIFDPFFTTKRTQGGTGLGLSVVKNIIDMHRGKLTIENRKDTKGAKVTVMLKKE